MTVISIRPDANMKGRLSQLCDYYQMNPQELIRYLLNDAYVRMLVDVPKTK